MNHAVTYEQNHRSKSTAYTSLYPNNQPHSVVYIASFHILSHPSHSSRVSFIFSLSFSLPLAYYMFFRLKETQVNVERMRKPSCDSKDLNKGAWSKQEDQKLIDYIKKHGEVCWRTLPQAAGLLRCGKSCRLRWINYLRPDLKRGNFSEDEEDLIIKLHALLGNRWSLIAGRLPGRTDNEVKNYWNSHIRRKLISKGIDPNNHRILNHKISSLENPPMSDDSSKPFGMKDNSNINSKNDTSKSPRHVYNYGEVSDAASGEAESSCALPDLNLDLSIAIPSASENNLKLFHESNSSRKLHFDSPSTLVLFQ